MTENSPTSAPATFDEVLAVELERVRQSREARRVPRPDAQGETVAEQAYHSGLIGLAFSGGGIRSATFNLGLLQGLARWNLLHAVDYLSTVSGGGYIGSWFHAWVKRAPGGIHEVMQRLADYAPRPINETPQPIKFLRRYSNYLTPRTGLLSTDTWTMISIWLRNTLLNQMILFLSFAAALLLPRAAKEIVDGAYGDPVSLAISIPLMLLAVFMMGLNLSTFDSAPTLLARLTRSLGFPMQQRKDQWFHRPGIIQLSVLMPIVLVSLMSSAWFAYYIRSTDGRWPLERASAFIGIALFVLLMLISAVGGLGRAFVRGLKTRRWIPLVALPAIDAAAAALGCGLLYLVCLPIRSASPDPLSSWDILLWGTPGFLLLFTFTMVMKIGLLGRDFPDERREWLSRLGASILLYLLGWLVLCGIAIYGPLWMFRLHVSLDDAWATGAFAGWAGTVATGLWAANSPSTGDPEKANRSPLTILARLAPPIFIGGLFLILSSVVHYSIVRLHGIPPPILDLLRDPQARPSQIFVTHHLQFMSLLPGGWAFVWACALFFLSWLLAVRVDINEFSLHQFYRNRLVRCYLGASRDRERKPNFFTGFDPDDDERLTRFGEGYGGPYPIVNAAMNLVHGENLAWQERKAESFVFTPEFCGFNVATGRSTHPTDRDTGTLSEYGYRRTAQYTGRGGPEIGTAMAISGAAASPNSGYHSNPAAAFLMTIFDVRLGWWVGNPRRRDHWQAGSPTLGLLYLFYELLGLTDDRRGFVYLSDGGHFENLALYELVRRRCKFIIVSDAEQDTAYKFEGLGNAIRKCRTDLNVEIDLAVDRMRPDPTTGLSAVHCIVGSIRYPECDASGNPLEGRIVYIKPVLTGDEPSDVLEYRRRDPAFPHTPTSDQWFDESQFESYRRLGLHAANTIFRNVAEEVPIATSRDRFFRMLSQQWHPPSRAVQSKFTEHTRTLSELTERLRCDHDLRFMHTQINPEWQTLMKQAADPPRPESWLPHKERELRAGYLFCNSIIQLMENVYIDLNLEEEWAHPDNRGWMNLFNHWVWSSMFRVTWAASASCYGARFQTFCQKRLELPLGQVQVRRGRVEDLNFYERRRYGQQGRPTDSIWRLELRVDNPVDPEQTIAYRFGFALVDAQSRLAFYRVQNHVRKMGLWSAVEPVLRETAQIQGLALRSRPSESK